MKSQWAVAVGLAALALAPAVAGARGLGVEVWTRRGHDAVYQPGERMKVEARTSDDAYLLVYEIDAEGAVRLLYPLHHGGGFVEGRRTYAVPPEQAGVDLVAEGPVGQCHVVAIASYEPFEELPWYLRPYDLQAEQIGYDGVGDDEDGITAEGRIVGDPFVAMERIRRRVLADAEDADAFATSYVTYYVHNEVRYPRYLCYDCHRPGRWAWWSGFDPYYTHCSVIDFRVAWGWTWGPRYWFGHLPYYTYVVRADCPPHYRRHYRDGVRFSSWDGWRRWKSMWGDRLVRYKSDPPRSYVPPSKFFEQRTRGGVRPIPPGFIVRDPNGTRTGRLVARDLDGAGRTPRTDLFRGDRPRERQGSDGFRSGERAPRPERTRAEESRRRDEGGRVERPRGAREDRSRLEWPGSRREERPRDQAPRPTRESREERRYEAPRPTRESREDRRYEAPRPSRASGSRVEWPGSRREERQDAAPRPTPEQPPRSEPRGHRSSSIEWQGSRGGERPRGGAFERPRVERSRVERSEARQRSPEVRTAPRSHEARPNDALRPGGPGHRSRN